MSRSINTSRMLVNGAPSPPLSPARDKAASSSVSAAGAADLQALSKYLGGLSKHAEAIKTVGRVTQDCDDARAESKVLKRSLAQTETELERVEKELADCKAKLQASQAKNREAETTLADKTAELKKDLRAKQADLGERSKELQKSKQELDEAKKKLGETKERVEKHRKAEDAALQAQRTLRADVEELQKGAAELTAMKSYLLPTQAMTTTEIARCLDGIFDAAYQVVYDCFSQDLADKVLAATSDDSPWRAFKRRLPGIPLPASNSADAKTMRIAAVLQYLAIVASEELFQPVYLGSGNDFGNTLASIPDAKQADVVRRMLLQAKAASKAAEAQSKAADGNNDDGLDNDDDDDDDDDKDRSSSERITIVLEDVFGLVEGLLSEQQAETFREELEFWAYNTAAVWESKLQPLQKRLDALPLPELSSTVVDTTTSTTSTTNKPPPDHWSALVYPETSLPSSSSPTRSTANSVSGAGAGGGGIAAAVAARRGSMTMARRGSMSVVSPGVLSMSTMTAPSSTPPRANATATATASAASVPAVVDPADVAFHIWPVFVLLDDATTTLVRRGCAVTKKQAARALAEDQRASAPSRTQRHMERAERSFRRMSGRFA